jgi:hypothetical protein
MRAVIIAILVAAGAMPLSGQPHGDGGDAVPRVGDRVRVTAPALGLRRATGRLDAMRADTLIVRELGPIPRDAVTRLDVSIGRRSAGGGAIRGATYGAAIGGGLGLVVLGIGVASDLRGACNDCMVSGTYAGAAAVVAGITSGMAAGAVAGVIVRPERWLSVSSPRAATTPTPPPRRLQPGLVLSFP